MKQTLFFKSSRNLLIGVGMAGALVPLTAVHAADQETPAQLELSQSMWGDSSLRNDTSTGSSSSTTQDQSTSGTSQSQGTSQSPDMNQTINNEPSGAGVQGPVRSEMSNEPSATDPSSTSTSSQRRNRRSSSSSDSSQDIDSHLSPSDGGHSDRQSNTPSYPPQ
ncbi:MAG: hypothetical protein ACM3X0_02535 [Bacteroidota bacterium]